MELKEREINGSTKSTVNHHHQPIDIYDESYFEKPVDCGLTSSPPSSTIQNTTTTTTTRNVHMHHACMYLISSLERETCMKIVTTDGDRKEVREFRERVKMNSSREIRAIKPKAGSFKSSESSFGHFAV
jgi:hypothetical protein